MRALVTAISCNHNPALHFHKSLDATWGKCCHHFLQQLNSLTFEDAGLDAILQHLLQGVVDSTDGRCTQRLHKIGHLPLGQIVGNGVVPGVRHALPVDAEHAGGKGVQVTRPRLDVVLRVVLGPTYM